MRSNFDTDFRLAKWLPQLPASPEIAGWLAGARDLSMRVKHNSKRSVYALFPAPSAAPSFFLKHDHPNRWGDILRSWIRPKVLGEFRVLEMLKDCGVPAIKPVACGWRYGQGVLITEALNGASTVADLWPHMRTDKERRRRLLAGLAELVRVMLQARVFHPDFHFGNILVTEKDGEVSCALVDVHGMKRREKLSSKRQAWMLRALAVLVHDLPQEEIQGWLAAVFPDAASEQRESFWRRLLRAAVEEAHRKWPDRRKKLLHARGRSNSLCRIAVEEDGVWRWRSDFDLIAARKALVLHQRLKTVRQTRQEPAGGGWRIEVENRAFLVTEFACSDASLASHRWLAHWRLELAGFPAPKCFAWFCTQQGTHYLLTERINAISLYDALREPVEDDTPWNELWGLLRRLLDHLYLWKFFYEKLDAGMIAVCRQNDGAARLFLVNVDPIQFGGVPRKKYKQIHFETLRDSLPPVSGLREHFTEFFNRWIKSDS